MPSWGMILAQKSKVWVSDICSNHLTHNKEYFDDNKSMVPIIVSRNIGSNCLNLEEKYIFFFWKFLRIERRKLFFQLKICKI